MSEASIPSDELLKSLTDRILRLREEEDALKADIREVYGEAKAQGFDKTILGKVVARIRAEAKDGDKLAETEELVDLYLSAYRGSLRAHTHAGARETAQEKAIPPHDPETGEVNEPAPIDPKLIETVVHGVQTEVGRKALIAAIDIMIEREERQGEHEPFTPPAFLSGERKPLRPHCQNPGNCSGYGRNHCHTCGKTAETEAA